MLTCETTAGALKAALMTVQPAVTKRGDLPILAMARFSGRQVSACDLDLQISVTIPAQVSEGEACLPVTPLLALARRLPADQELRITSDGKTADIDFGSARFRVAALAASDFPEILVREAGAPMDVDGDGLKKAIAFVMRYAGSEDTRYYLNGICFDDDKAVATDGHRLASHPLGFNAGVLQKAILPSLASKALVKMPPVRSVIASATGHPTVQFSMDSVTVTAKLIDGKYPEWQRVVPGNAINARFKIGRADMLETLRRMLAVLPTGHSQMQMAWRGDVMAVAALGAFDDAQAQDSLPISGLDGVDGNIGFSLRYMVDALAMLRGLNVEVSYTAPGDPIILRSDGGGMLVQMPRRDDGKLTDVCASILDNLAPKEAA